MRYFRKKIINIYFNISIINVTLMERGGQDKDIKSKNIARI